MEKIRKAKFNTAKGERSMMMRPVLEELEEGEVFCDSICPYGEKICSRLPDPEFPDKPTERFCDFCTRLGEIEGQEFCNNMVPVEGEIERVFPDFPDIIKVLEEENPLVKISDVIDEVCKGGCDMYSPDHSNCSSKNQLCILKGLLRSKKRAKNDE